jgi:Fe2+ or Zn2+ uptake regulation protein
MELSSDQQNEATDSVLRVLYQAGVALSPDSIVANLDVYADDSHHEATVQTALDGLEEASLVRRLDQEGDYYVVTDSGADFLETEIDQESLGFSG